YRWKDWFHDRSHSAPIGEFGNGSHTAVTTIRVFLSAIIVMLPRLSVPERQVASSRSCSSSVRNGAGHSPDRDAGGQGYAGSWINTTSVGRYARDDVVVFKTMGDAR
ncbi:hypothetical protein LINGRAHAP2_LOCUS11050, partial [Linum grandiflorum]